MKRFLSILAVLFLSVSCLSQKDESSSVAMYTSIYPVYSILHTIAGDDVPTGFVIPAGANPHTYEPAPSEVAALQKATTFIAINPHFDGWITDFTSSSQKVRWLFHKEENPHHWLSMEGARSIARSVTEELSKAVPEKKADFEKRRDHFLNEIDLLEKDLQEQFAAIPNRKIIQWHPAWSYFAKEFDITIAGTLQKGHGHTPSIRQLQSLIDKSKKENIRVVVIGLNLQSSDVDTLVRETGATLVRLDGIGAPDLPDRSDYISLMKYNASKLIDALKGNK